MLKIFNFKQMARRKISIGGEISVAAVTRSSRGRWILVEGEAQAVSDYLDTHNFPTENVKDFELDSGTWYVWVKI